MLLSQAEISALLQRGAGDLARSRKARRLPLNYAEAVSLIAVEVERLASIGIPERQVIRLARKLLTSSDVLPGVREMLDEIIIILDGKSDIPHRIVIKHPIRRVFSWRALRHDIIRRFPFGHR